jgi:DNA repair exonuclease SbcCD ATPase subunit
MTIFKRIRFKNFLGVGDEFIEIELNKSPSTLIMGRNGCGKSTVLDALTFSLFGDAFRNINLPQLINDLNENDMLVEVEFSIGRTNYKIRRGLKPRIFEIYINNVLLNQDSKARDYQKYLEQTILKLNKKSFNQVVILGSASYIPFMQLTCADRRFIIEDLLDIQIFSLMNIALKLRVAEMKEEYIEISNGIEIQNEKISLVKSYLKKLRLDSVNAIAEKKTIIEENEDQKNTDIETIEEIRQEIDELLATITDQTRIQETIRNLETSEDKLKATRIKTEKERNFYEISNECPTCKQVIDEDFKDGMVKRKTELVKEIETALEQLQTDLNKSETRLEEIVNIVKVTEIKSQEINNLTNSIRAIDNFISKVKKEIEDLQERNGDTGEQEKKLKRLQNELAVLTVKRDTITSRKHYLDIVSMMLKDSGIKTKIIRQYLPIINKYVNRYLSAMDFFANFNLDENFKETIHIRGSKERTYYQLSEGQKLRIDLAILFTWREVAKLKNSANTNLLVMDEIFESSLDPTGVEDFLKLLQNLSRDVNIFIISPQGDMLIDKFNNVIKFTENQGFSVMEQN